MSCKSISYCQSQQKVKPFQGCPQRSKISVNGMSLHGEGEGGLREREQSSWWCSYGTWRDHGLWISDKPHLCEVVTHPVVTNACLHLESSPIHK